MRWAGFIAAAALWAQQGLEIQSARYGAGNTWLDVTTRLQGLVQDGRLNIRVDIETLGSDPAPGVGKRLEIRYRSGGTDLTASAADFESLAIPAAGGFSIRDLFEEQRGTRPPESAPAAPATPAASPEVAPLGTAGSLRIFYARYGAGTQRRDVRESLRPLLRENRLSVKVDNRTLGGDPATGKDKTLEVIYEVRGRTFSKEVREGGTLTLP